MASPAKKPPKKASGAAAKPAVKKAAQAKTAVAKKATAKSAKPSKSVVTAKKPLSAKAAANSRGGANGKVKEGSVAGKIPAPKESAPVKEAPKTATAKKPAVAVVAKPKKGPFSPKEMEAIRVQLIAQRANLENEAADLNAGTFDSSQSELSGEVAFDEEYADAGTFTFERERDLSLGNNIRDLMDKIDAALVKIARGTYGICERCGEAIDRERMKALPYSVLDIKCKQLEERRR